MSLDRDAIIADNPLLPYCEARGWQLKRDGNGRWKCLCPFHDEDSASFTIYPEDNHFFCFGCKRRGSVIDVHMHVRGIDVRAAMRDLSREGGNDRHSGNGSSRKPQKRHGVDPLPSDGHPEGRSLEPEGPQRPSSKPGEPEPRETACYGYQDAIGQVVYQVVRYEPKAFKQCRIVDGGKRVWNMDGVERLPYRLPELLAHPASVWIVEGEKDVETLRSIGQTATCNPGGAGNWLPAFSQYLRGKCVYLAPDNDETGQKHMRSVLESLGGLVEWVRWVELPPEFNGSPVKDVSDLRVACKDADEFISCLVELQKGSRLIERGIESRCRTMTELEADYIAGLSRLREVSLSLGNWLPGFGVRALGPGDLLGILADYRADEVGNGAQHSGTQRGFAGGRLQS